MTREPKTHFDYDPAASLEPEPHGVKQHDGVSIADLSFTTLQGDTWKAYWLTPPGHGPFAAVLYVHPAPGSRETFLNEALTLARQGAASLLLQAPWAQPEAWMQKVSKLKGQRKLFTQIAIDLRRLVDWMLAQPDIDLARVGFVGHSLGALMGGILSGVEKRIKAFVLMAGSGSFTDVAVANVPDLQGEPLRQYAESIAPIDPVHYVNHASPSAVFYQIALNDQVFPLARAQAFADAGSEPKLVSHYTADHYLNSAAQADRIEWLQTRLDLKPLAANQKKGANPMARNESNQSVGKKNKGAGQETPKRTRKGSGPGTTKGTRKRTEIGLSKGLNKGGAQGVAHSGEPKPRTK